MAPVALLVLALAAAQAPPPSPESPPPGAGSHTLLAELTRVDLSRGSITLRTGGAEDPREVEISVDEERTRIVSAGREARLADLRTGERVLVLCSDEGRRHGARLVKLGPFRYAAPPAASPKP